MSDYNKNFNLSEQEFHHLLEDLKNGDDLLFKKIFVSQVDNCIQQIQFRFSATYDNAYDAVLESIIMIRNRMIEGKVQYGNLNFLLSSISSQYYQRQFKKQLPTVDIDVGLLSMEEMDDEDSYDDQQITDLKVAISQLGDQCQELLQLNYFLDLNLSEIAEKLQRSHEAIRKQKQRCKDQLKEIFLSINKSKE